MTPAEIEAARRDIEATGDLLERALKLSGLVTSLFQAHGVAVPSRRAVSYNTSERHMRKAFGGARAPQFAAREGVL